MAVNRHAIEQIHITENEEEEVVMKDSAIQEKAGEIEALAEDKRRQDEESENTVERTQLVHSVETNQLLLENEDLKGQLEDVIVAKDLIITNKDSMLTTKDTSLQKKEDTIDFLTSKPQSLQVQLSYSQCSEAPVEMSSGQAVTINGKVYYGGGFCDDDDDEYCVHCYDPPQDVWSTLPRLPVRYFGLGEVKGELVAVGGADSFRSKSNMVHEFNKGRNWKQTIPPMPTTRAWPAVVSLPTHLVVAGGLRFLGALTDKVEIYNISTSQWSETDKLPYACEDQRGIVYNNTVYLMGGSAVNHLNKVCAAQVDKLISADHQDDGSAKKSDSVWNTISNTPSYAPSPVTISDTLFAIGGVDSERKAIQRIYAYSSSMDSWLYVGDLPSPIAFAATVSLSPTECLVIGGDNKNDEYKSTVLKLSLKNVMT